jgi:hypothetical protein
MKKSFAVLLVANGILASYWGFAQKAPAKSKSSASAANRAGTATWSPEVQQFLGVEQGSFRMVGLNRLSKAQVEALVNVARQNLTGDPRKHVITCGPATPAPQGRYRVLLTVSGDDPSGQRATEIRQAIAAADGIDLVDSAATADRTLHVVIQEQTLGKRTIGYTASYVTVTPCLDTYRKTEVELKGQLGTYTDPRGTGLANDLARMLKQDLATMNAPPPQPATAP